MTVSFDDYRSGSLPDICVFTGKPTDDRMVMRTPIVEREYARKSSGPFVGFLTQLTVIENPREPRNILLGRLPVDAGHLRNRQRAERMLRFGRLASTAMLLLAAVAAQPWSPVLAVLALVGLSMAVIRGSGLNRNVPTPTLIGSGTRVHLANVHQNFVDAATIARRRG